MNKYKQELFLLDRILAIALSQKYNLKNILIINGIIGVIISLVVVPLKVTVDGSLYISSAKSLYSQAMRENYHWVREPAYPVLLRLVNDLLGSSDLGIIFIQSILLMSAAIIVIYIFFYHLNLHKINLLSIFVLLLISINPYYLLFSGLILQQSLFAFYLSIYLLFLFYAQMKKFNIRQTIWYYFLFFAFYIVSVLTSPVFRYLGVIVLLLTMFFKKTSSNNKNNLIYKINTIGVSIFLILTFYVGGNSILSVWNNIRVDLTAGLASEDNSVRNEPIEISVSQIILEIEESPTRTLNDYQSRFLALLHFKKDDTWPFSELAIYSELMLFSGWRCGAVDPFEVEPFATFSKDFFTANCRSERLHSWYSKIGDMNPHLYWMTIISTLVVMLLFAVRRDYIFLTLYVIPLFFLASYIFINAGLDRYGIPIYPWLIASTLVLLNIKYKNKKFSV